MHFVGLKRAYIRLEADFLSKADSCSFWDHVSSEIDMKTKMK